MKRAVQKHKRAWRKRVSILFFNFFFVDFLDVQLIVATATSTNVWRQVLQPFFAHLPDIEYAFLFFLRITNIVQQEMTGLIK